LNPPAPFENLIINVQKTMRFLYTGRVVKGF